MVDLVIVSLVHQSPEMVEWMADNLKRYLAGRKLNNLVDLDRGY